MALLVIKSVSKEILGTRSLFDEPPTPYEAPEPIAPGAVAVWATIRGSGGSAST